jgi:penicillin amidase
MSDEKMKSIVLDVRDKYAETVLNYLLNILKTAPMDKKEKDIYLKLKGFDFLMKKEKEEPLLFYRFLIKVLENTFKELLGDTLYDKFIDLYYFPFNVLENWLHSDMVSRSDIVQAFREIVKDYKKESYGEYHKSKFHHPFSNSKIIGRMFRLKSIPLDGGITTVNKMEFSITNPFDVIEGPSMRMIVNLRDNKFYYILPPGESGVVFDKNYSDMIELWAEGEFLELFPFNAVNKLFIYPISQ